MSISAIQKRVKSAEYAMELARKGIEPNTYEVNKMLTEHFDNHTPGMPIYSPIEQKAYAESNKANFNHNFETLKEDLDTMYRANVETNNTAVAMQEYYAAEKDRVVQEIQELQMRINSIYDSINNGGSTAQYNEAFNTLYGVDYYGNDDKNIPATSAFIDLLQKNVYIPKTDAAINKIDISDAAISIKGNGSVSTSVQQGKITNIVNDIYNDYVIIQCAGRLQYENQLIIDLDFGKDITFDSVFIKFTSASQITMKLYVSEDGENYVPAYDMTGTRMIEWIMHEQNARWIRIICSKTEYDVVSNANYIWWFLISNITIAYEHYHKSAVVTTNQIDLEQLVSRIKFDAEDMNFSHTKISYFLGYDNGNRVEWDVLKNHEWHELAIFQKLHKIASAYYEEFGEHNPVLNAYALITLPDGTCMQDVKVTPGYNMWGVKRYTGIYGDSIDNNFSINTGDFSDHVAQCNMEYMFMDCENYDNFSILSNVLYIFTQYVDLEHADSLFNSQWEIYADNGLKVEDAEVRVFLNGYESGATDTNLYSLGLKKGVNKIQIAVYCPSETADEYKLRQTMNFKKLTSGVYAYPPMKRISPTMMEKKTVDEYGCYCVKDNTIYVRPDPNTMVRSFLNDMPYYITYKCLKPEYSLMFPDKSIKIRLMAVLTTDDPCMSPRLSSMRICAK